MSTHQTLCLSACASRLCHDVVVVSPVPLIDEKAPGLFQDLVIACLLTQTRCKDRGIAMNHCERLSVQMAFGERHTIVGERTDRRRRTGGMAHAQMSITIFKTWRAGTPLQIAASHSLKSIITAVFRICRDYLTCAQKLGATDCAHFRSA